MDRLRALGLNDKSIKIIVLSILIAGLGFFSLRNLNYNSAFSDEAIYIIIGKIGLDYNDWYTYNAQSWVGGLIYFYPVMTTFGYHLGGIVGSRAFNVLLGLLTSIVIAKWVMAKTDNYGVSILSMLFLALSGSYLFVSRLATYDMPSVFFLVLSLFLLDQAHDSLDKFKYRKLLFFSSFSIIISILFKFTSIIYLPIWILWSFYKRKDLVKTWSSYGLIWLVLVLGLVAFSEIDTLTNYAQLQSTREVYPRSLVLDQIHQDYSQIMVLFILGVISLGYSKKFNYILLFTSMVATPLIIHLYLGRIATLEKHLVWSITFSLLTFGIGVGSWFKNFSPLVRNIWIGGLTSYLLIYALNQNQIYNSKINSWINATSSNQKLYSSVRKTDLVLTEVGPSTMLELYNKINPITVTTFDWVRYRDYNDMLGYRHAVRDGLFHWIQVEKNELKSERNSRINDYVLSEIDQNYSLFDSSQNILIYKRKF